MFHSSLDFPLSSIGSIKTWSSNRCYRFSQIRMLGLSGVKSRKMI